MTTKYLTMIGLILLVFYTTGCSLKSDENICRIDSLLLDVSAFPDNGWEEIGSRDIRGAPSKLGIERAGTSFSTMAQGVANHIIYHFDSAEVASKNYYQLQLDWFNLASEGSVWVEPAELADIDPNANEFRLDCSINTIEICRFVARYQVYVVEFATAMPALTYDDLIRLIQAIDHKMVACLNLQFAP